MSRMGANSRGENDMPVSKKPRKSKAPVLLSRTKRVLNPLLTGNQQSSLFDRLLRDRSISKDGIQLGIMLLISVAIEHRVESSFCVITSIDELCTTEKELLGAWSALVQRGYIEETSREFEVYNAEELEEYGDEKSLIINFKWLL